MRHVHVFSALCAGLLAHFHLVYLLPQILHAFNEVLPTNRHSETTMQFQLHSMNTVWTVDIAIENPLPHPCICNVLDVIRKVARLFQLLPFPISVSAIQRRIVFERLKLGFQRAIIITHASTRMLKRRLHERERKRQAVFTAIQHGNAIFSIMVSFHAEEEGVFNHQDRMPDVPPPEKLTAEEVSKQPMFKEMPEFIRRYYESDRPIELRPVELGRYFGQKIDDGRIHVWIRTAAKLPDDPALHLCALAYASDFSLLDAVMARYGRTLFDRRMMPASLDHAMWFHRPFRADKWLLYAQDSPSAQDGRGLTRGLIFKPDGTLVASVAQEGSVRQRRA